VSIITELDSSIPGGGGTGGANIVQFTVDIDREPSVCQRLYQRYLGWSVCIRSLSCLTRIFDMPGKLADRADMAIHACFAGVGTSARVEPLASG